jgi:hypothetical protein
MCINNADETIFSVAETCSQLTTLRISKCVQVTDSALLALGRGCPLLRVLDLSLCPGFTDIGLLGLVIGHRPDGLLEIYEDEYGKIHTDALIKRLQAIKEHEHYLGIKLGCSHLEEIDLSGCFGIRESGIRYLTTFNPNLREVILAKCPALNTSTVLACLTTHCPNIQRYFVFSYSLHSHTSFCQSGFEQLSSSSRY